MPRKKIILTPKKPNKRGLKTITLTPKKRPKLKKKKNFVPTSKGRRNVA